MNSINSNAKNWRMFRANNLITLMNPTLYICRIFGIISYKIVDHKIEYAKKVRLYCFVVTSFHIISSILIMYIINASTFMNRISTWMLQGNCFYTLGNFILVSNYIFGKSIVKILQNLDNTSTKLPKEKFEKISKWIHSKDLILYFLLLIHVPKLFRGDVYLISFKIIGTYATATTYLLDFQFVNYVIVIGTCFQHLNEELVKLKDNAFSERIHLLRRVYHNQFNPMLFVKLRYLKQWHYELNEIIRQMNSTFSLQLVATVILTFTEMTFGLYFYILDMLHKTKRNVDKEIWFHYYFSLVTNYSLKILLLALTCQSANDENYKTRTIVNEIIINTDDKLFKEELHLFSLQLLHTNNIFIAKGVQLDATLLTAMSKGIFTYLLILIQFMKSNT